MKSDDREVKESPLYQGEDEQIAYSLTTTPWVSTPASPTVKIFSIKGGVKTDTSTTNLSGSASATGDIITTPLVKSLVDGTQYRWRYRGLRAGIPGKHGQPLLGRCRWLNYP